MDDVRIHNRAMDADEVAYWYAETTVVAEELIGHWNFDNGDLSAVVGSAGTNDGASFVTLADRTAVLSFSFVSLKETSNVIFIN